MILFATKRGLNFHGLYHIVLRCTRLQSEASRRGQSEREGIYIYLVCGLMAPYVCEEKWQAEVGSERRPTTPPHSHCAPHLPSSRHMLQTNLPSFNAVLSSLNTLGWVCKSFCTPVDITHTAAVFISLSDKRADGRPTVLNSKINSVAIWRPILPFLITVICEIRMCVVLFYPCYCDCTLVLTSSCTSAFTAKAITQKQTI